jgi:hypothetical protein
MQQRGFPRRHEEDGLSLIEVLIATCILAGALVSLAQLFAIAIRTNLTARGASYATILAEQKIEELRARAWSVDAQGVRLSDGGLTASPRGSLNANMAGYVDYADQFGRTLVSDVNRPPNAVYTRRWAITASPTDPDDTLVIQVRVMRDASNGASLAPAEEARFTTLRTRKAR